MNPSASGWITKFGHLIASQPTAFTDYSELYTFLKKSGFVYGIHVEVPQFINVEHKLTEDEIAKINLLIALYYSYAFEKKQVDFENFVKVVFAYYQELEVGKISFLKKILSGSKTSAQLEKLIDSRIYLGGTIVNKSVGGSITNSLLYIDVLIFINYIQGHNSIITHAELLEYVTINLAYHTLHSKEANKNDEKLIKLLASSLTYINMSMEDFDGTYMDLLQDNFTTAELDYLLDIACLTVWEDHSLEYTESEFIFGIGKNLGKVDAQIENALNDVMLFFEKNKENAAYLKHQNMALNFYDGVSKNVSKLILRNGKRLKKELSESKELLALLSKSTIKELSKEEKKKVQNQLLDIFKTIPSLAIFMLPGGSILLPIAIRLIPKLLPSAFDENRIEKP